MFKNKGAALSTIKGYRAMLAAVFKFPLPEISSSPVLKDLVRSFEISAPRPIFPWGLDKVLEFLSGPPFEPLARASFLDKTKKALFLLAMATAKRVSELQALSFSVSFQGEDLVLYYDLFFRAKTESVINPLPRSVVVPSIGLRWRLTRETSLPCQSCQVPSQGCKVRFVHSAEAVRLT